MDSKDLPVTEYWDPDWDVYDVPGSPFEDDVVDGDVWWAAYEHLWWLRWIMAGSAEYIPFQFAHQLTTGAERAQVCSCSWRTVDSGTIFQDKRIPNPACEFHTAPAELRPAPPETPACLCSYGLRDVPGAPGPWVVYRPPGIRRGELRTWAFKIHPRCPHHGEARRSGPHIMEGGGLYEFVLDERERRGE